MSLEAENYAKLTLNPHELQADSSVFGAKFHDIPLAKLGTTFKGKNPFMQLKKIAMDKTVSAEDRIQAVRYMVKIPHIHMVKNAVEAAETIIDDDNIPIGERYFFFSNNENGAKLEGHVVQNCHLYFFKSFATKVEYPLIFRLLSAQVIYCDFVHTDDNWSEAREFIIRLCKDKNQSVSIRSEAADVLLRKVSLDDMAIGQEVISELGDLYFENKRHTIYTNSQNAHNDMISESVMNIVRTLAIEKRRRDQEEKLSTNEISSFSTDAHGQGQNHTTGTIFDRIKILIKDDVESKRNKVMKAFNHILIYPSKYEGLCMSDILILIWIKIQQQQDTVRKELENRLVEELYDMYETCGTGYVSRLVNILSGYIQEENLQIKMSPKDQLRANIFARLQTNLRHMSSSDQDIILDEIATEGSSKDTAKEFVETYSVKDELLKEFVEDHSYLSREEFEVIYDKCIKDFFG